jgi:tetratricopeptide (TPR) repeat protein
MEKRIFGQGHTELLNWLTNRWLKQGPPICFVEGFSGTGKTRIIADNLMTEPGWKAIKVDMPEQSNPLDELLVTLAGESEALGYQELVTAFDEGKSLPKALTNLLRQKILIVIDEFQRAFPIGSGKPIPSLEQLLSRIAQRPNLPGRILLLSNQLVERGRWSEPYEIRTLSGLSLTEAEEYLDRLLKQDGREQEVPIERRQDVVNWLGRNPRAISTLVQALRNASLDELIGISPEIWEARDRDISAELLHRLETDLLERVLSYLPSETLSFLRQLSVHRRSFKKLVMERLTADYQIHSAELIKCFLLEQHIGWYSLNPIAREIMLQRLKENPREWKRAHSQAADYYTRHFKAQGEKSEGVRLKLGGYFFEARYHLVQAQREPDLIEIAGKFERYLRMIYSTNEPIPTNRDELSERIVMLSVLLESAGAKGLEYYLARLLQARGEGDDLNRALKHVRRATGSRAPFETWRLRIDLERQVNGLEQAIKVAKQAIHSVPVDQGLVVLYISCGNLLVQADRIDEAIALQQQGINRIPADSGLGSLYVSCGKLLAQSNRIDDAIDLLQQGIESITTDRNLAELYISCGHLLAQTNPITQTNRIDEAIALLHEGIHRIAPNKNLVGVYVCCGQLLIQAKRTDEAIALLQQGIQRIPPDKGVHSLYFVLGKIFAQIDELDRAIGLFQQGIQQVPVDKSLPSLYTKCATFLNYTKRHDDAIKLLQRGIQRIPVSRTERHRLVKDALLTCLATHNQSKFKEILVGTGQNQLTPQDLVLGRILSVQLQQDWKQAAEIAHQGRLQFPTDPWIAQQEAFSWLCCGDATAADQALQNFPRPRYMKKNNPLAWLRAWIALKNGDFALATLDLEVYLDRSLQVNEVVTDDLLLSLWDAPVDFQEENYVSFYFPILPPTLTGLEASVTRPPYGAPVLPAQRPLTSVTVETSSTESSFIPTTPDAIPDTIEEAPMVDSTPQAQSGLRIVENLPLFAKVGVGALIAVLAVAGILEIPKLSSSSTNAPEEQPETSATLTNIDIVVKAEEDGRFLEEVEIEVKGKGPSVFKETNSRGYAQIQIPTTEGNVDIVLRKKGYNDFSDSIDPKVDPNRNREYELQPIRPQQ